MPPPIMSLGLTLEEHNKREAEKAAKIRRERESAERDEEAKKLQDVLENMDPETERIVQAVVRRQERAMRKQYSEYYKDANDTVQSLAAKIT